MQYVPDNICKNKSQNLCIFVRVHVCVRVRAYACAIVLVTKTSQIKYSSPQLNGKHQ